MNNAPFPGLIRDTLDLSAYLEPEQSYQIRPAHEFTEAALDILAGRAAVKGLPLPWAKAAHLLAFRPAEVTVWTGFKGHGKSMMLSQVCLHALYQGERVLIISPEFRPEAVLARKLRQAAATNAPAEAYARRFLRWAGDGRLYLFDNQGSLNPETVTSVIRYAVDRHQVTHVVVDSLMKCGIPPDDFARQKRFVDDLQSIAHQTGIHLHLVAHARKSENDEKPARLHDVKGASELCDMAENVVSTWKNKRKLEAASRGDKSKDNDPDALLIVDSQRNGEGWTGAIQLWFDQPSFQFIGDRFAEPRSWLDQVALNEE